MVEDPLLGLGLRPVTLADRNMFESYFSTLQAPLSDYTFSQLFTWRNSLHIAWKLIRNHLCIFANGSSDLTLLMPPIGDGQSSAALAEAFELMDAYNASAGVPANSRIEYASDELLARFDATRLNIHPMGTDYVYDTRRMIDLAGGDLSSKRQAKNRFIRNYQHHVETYDAARHFNECVALLHSWTRHQDEHHTADAPIGTIKRHKESLACELSLRYAAELGLRGMVLHVNNPAGQSSIRGFTFGESLGHEQNSIVIEKTDLELKGMAQFIFSEFCERFWANKPYINVGDDWGLETLAWTKRSYRPVKLLQKYVLRQTAALKIGFLPRSQDFTATTIKDRIIIRPARREDLAASATLEQSCFTTYSLTRRRLQYLQQRPSAVFLVAQQGDQVVGQGIALIRQNRKAKARGHIPPSGRIYSLAVTETARGQKIGRRLLKALVQRLVDQGVHRIYLEVEQLNSAAIHLYKQAGFNAIGEIPDYYGKDRPAQHMMWQQAAQAHRPITEIAA